MPLMLQLNSLIALAIGWILRELTKVKVEVKKNKKNTDASLFQ